MCLAFNSMLPISMATKGAPGHLFDAKTLSEPMTAGSSVETLE